MKPPRNPSSSHGYSLLEIIVVIAIFTALATLSVPQLASLQATTAIKVDHQRIQNILQRCILESRAYKETLELSYVANQLKLVQHTRQLPIAAATLDRRSRLHGSRQSIICYASRTVTPGTIVLSNAHQRCTITVCLRGRV